MPNVLRRRLLQNAAATMILLIAPGGLAQAQLGTAVRLIIEAIGAVSAGLDILQYMNKWLGDKRCNVSVNTLEELKFETQTLALSVGIALPLLKEYIAKGDQDSWVHAKTALGTFLNNGKELMSAVNDVVNKLDPETYPGSQEDIKKLYSGLSKIRAAVSLAASLPDKPSPETVAAANSVLQSISDLPTVAGNAISELEGAVEDRRRVSCPG